jgi:hypothetical protein
VRETRCKAPHVRIAFEAHTRRRFDQNGRGYGRSDAEPDFHEIEQHVVPSVDRAQRFTDAADVSEARECIGERRRRLATIFEMTAQFAAQIISAPAARHPCGFEFERSQATTLADNVAMLAGVRSQSGDRASRGPRLSHH